MFPDLIRGNDGHISEPGLIRGENAAPTGWQGERFRETAACWNGEQPGDARVTLAIRDEEDVLAVRRPSDRHVGARMVGQPPRYAAVNTHHVNIYVPLVLAAKGNVRAVRRKDWPGFDSRPRRKTHRVATLARDGPKIPSVGKNDSCLTERGRTE